MNQTSETRISNTSAPTDLSTAGQTDDLTSPESASSDRIHWRNLLQRKLLIRITIPTFIGLIQLGFAILAIIQDSVSPVVLLWMLPAMLVGYLFGKSTKIDWDNESSQISLVQAQLLLAVSYIVVRIGTHYVLEKFLSGRMWIAIAVLLVSFGLFFGRSLGLSTQIWKALKEDDILNQTGPTPRHGA